MKKKLNIMLCIYLGLFHFSCYNKLKDINDNIERIIVNPDESEEIKLSTFCEQISYINLETDSNCFIAHIDKIIFFKKNVYILDKTGKKLLVFNCKGDHLFNIGSFGKGPGQFINPIDFVIDRKNKHIEIYDITQRKNLIYHLDGHFLYEKLMPFRFIFYEKLDNDVYVFQTRKIDNYLNNKNLPFDVLMTNKDNSLIRKYFKYDPALKERGGAVDLTQVFTWCNDTLLISKLFIDTTYFINKDDLTLKPAFVFDYNKYSLPQNKRNLKFSKAVSLINTPGKYAFGHMIHGISDSLVCFTYGFNNPIFEKRILGLYFRKTKRSYSISRIINDMDNGTFAMPILCNTDTLISALYPENAMPELTNRCIKLSKWKETDNPVLMLMKIKEPNF
jgi:hypothetical protein